MLELAQGSGVTGPLLQNINLQMARDEYELNGQQGLDQLLSVLGGEEVQVIHPLQNTRLQPSDKPSGLYGPQRTQTELCSAPMCSASMCFSPLILLNAR